MREHYEQSSTITRRLTAALVGVWLGVSCLFCCGDVTDAHAAHSVDAAAAATRAAAPGDDCCRAHLQHHDKNAARDATLEGVSQDATAENGARDDAAPGARVGRLASQGGEPCFHCSRQVANSARRVRVLPAPASASDSRQAQAIPRFTADASRGGRTLLLNRGGTHARLCVLRI